jgi:polysaccharide pyruvyl transferase WcaK-like protein
MHSNLKALKTSNKIILFRAKISHKNLGDQLINKILLNHLRRYGTLVVDDREVPRWYCEQLNLKDNERLSNYSNTFHLFIIKLFLNSLTSKNYSKKLFYVKTPGSYQGNIRNLKRLVKEYFYHIIYSLIGVHVCCFGISVGPFSKNRELFEKLIANSMFFYSVRDSVSDAYARRIGIKKVFRFPDLALLADFNYQQNVDENTNKDYVIFSFRDSSKKHLGPVYDKRQFLSCLDKIADLVSTKWDKKILFTYQVKGDDSFCRFLYERYKNTYKVDFFDEMLNENNMQSLYSKSFLTFSNRLHVLIFSGIFGAMPVAVIDSDRYAKITGIFKDMKLSKAVIDISDSNLEVENLDKKLLNLDKAIFAESKLKFLVEGNKIFDKIFINNSNMKS